MSSRRQLLRAAAGAAAAAALAPAARAAAPAAATGDELCALPARELSRRVHAGEVSCVEVMAACLDRVERLNPRYNAIVSLRPREALLAEAAQADRELRAGDSRGWLHGLPHAVKDLADAAGLPTTAGSPLFRGRIAREDSLAIGRIRSAGAIFIGKTNVPEFGLGSQTYNPVFGATHSAVAHGRTAGGSSGGAACALALELVPVADGSDLMGSLRNPAAFNNVIGFRPTPGLVPLYRGFFQALACSGPMARNVGDVAWLLATMAGPDPRYPQAFPVDTTQYLRPLAAETRGLRIGWLGDFDGYLPFEDGILPQCEAALAGFRDIGCAVEGALPDYDMAALWRVWLTYRHWLVSGRLGALYDDPDKRALLKPEAVWEVEGGRRLEAADLRAAMAGRDAWYRAVTALFQRFDFLVLPTAQVYPFPVETHWPREIAGRPMDSYHRWMEVVIPGTLSGCPVINVPAGFSSAGLPMGLQIIAPRYGERRLLEVAHGYEQATRSQLGRPPAMGGNRA